MVLRVAEAAVWAEAVDLSSDVVFMPSLSTQQNIAWWWIDFFHHKITAVGLNRWLLLPFTRRILFSSTLIRFMVLRWGGFMDQSLWGAILQWNIKSKNLQQNTRPNLKGKKQPLTAKQLLSRSYPARKRRVKRRVRKQIVSALWQRATFHSHSSQNLTQCWWWWLDIKIGQYISKSVPFQTL